VGTTSRPTREVTRRIISISVADTGSYTRDCSLVVLLGEAGTNRRRGLASPFFLPSASSSFLTISLPRCQPPPPPLYLFSTVLSSRATSSERGLRLSGTGAA